jgi:hypothetical protein
MLLRNAVFAASSQRLLLELAQVFDSGIIRQGGLLRGWVACC